MAARSRCRYCVAKIFEILEAGILVWQEKALYSSYTGNTWWGKFLAIQVKAIGKENFGK